MRQQRGETRKWLVSYEDGNDTLHTFSVAVPSTLMPGCKVEDTADTLPVGEIKNVYIDPGLVRAVLRRVHARKPIIFRTDTVPGNVFSSYCRVSFLLRLTFVSHSATARAFPPPRLIIPSPRVALPASHCGLVGMLPG